MAKQFFTRDALIAFALIVSVCLLRIATLSLYPIPFPVITDEFSNMLGAQTFALGRLTNPPAVFHDAFLEYHVVDAPTRMMRYQPLMAGFMGLGIVLFGNAYWGVVLCMALGVASGYWCLRGWLTRPVALSMAVLLLLLLRAPHYWMQSYWGGGPIMLASFLMLGAYGRVFLQQRYGYIAVGLIGVVLALLTRPFEGILLAACLTIAGVWHLVRENASQRRELLKHSVLPVAVILPAYAAFQLLYNHAITGSWWMLPHAMYDQLYGVASSFVFGSQKMGNLSAHYAMRAMQEWELGKVPLKNAAGGVLYFMSMSQLLQLERVTGIVAIILGMAFLGFFFFWLPLRAKGVLRWTWVVLFAGYLLTTGVNPHYLAPLFAVNLIIIGRWAELRRRAAAGVMVIMLPFMALLDGEIYALKDGKAPMLRQESLAMLMATPGDDLVLVDERSSEPSAGWVYNAPDIDSAPVVWAWHLSPKENKALIAHYPQRKVWYIAPGNMMPPTPYKEP